MEVECAMPRVAADGLTAAARRDIDEHLTNRAGNCIECGLPGPCPTRLRAVSIVVNEGAVTRATEGVRPPGDEP
jgi:hypothetical protein